MHRSPGTLIEPNRIPTHNRSQVANITNTAIKKLRPKIAVFYALHLLFPLR